jgi:hypothetical protein
MLDAKYHDLAHRYISGAIPDESERQIWTFTLNPRTTEKPPGFEQVDALANGLPVERTPEIVALKEWVNDVKEHWREMGIRHTVALHLQNLSYSARGYAYSMLSQGAEAAMHVRARQLAYWALGQLPSSAVDVDVERELLAILNDIKVYRVGRRKLRHPLPAEAHEALLFMVTLSGDALPLGVHVLRETVHIFWRIAKEEVDELKQ